MRVGEPQALAGQPIEMRRGDAPGRVERADVAVAEVVGEDQEHIGARLGGAVCGRAHGEQQGGEESAHPRILP